MDSVNCERSENIDRKNAAINTEPDSGCALCGSRSYLQQSFPQGNCFRPFCSGSNPCEDGFSNLEPIFSSPPLLQPIIQSKFVPSNAFYTSLTMSPSMCVESVDSQESDTDKMPKQQPQFFIVYPPTIEPGANNFNYNKDPKKCDDTERETEVRSENRCSFPSTSPAGNMIPWTCGPCIVPMVSYIVSLNPVYQNKKLSENLGMEKSAENNEKNKDVLQAQETPEVGKSVEVGGKLEKSEWKTGLNGSSTSFVSVCNESADCTEERGLKSAAQVKTEELAVDKKLEDLEEVINDEETDSVVQTEGNNYIDIQNVCLDSLQGNLTDTFIMSSSISPTDIHSDIELSGSSSEITNAEINNAAEQDAIPYSQNRALSTEKLQEGLQESKSKERNPIKFINNFTMSNEGKPEPEEESNESESGRIAAAGDILDKFNEGSVLYSKLSSNENKLNTQKSTENLIQELEGGERPLTVENGTNKKSVKCAIGKSVAGTKPKDSTAALESTQEDPSIKKPSNPVMKRKQYFMSPKTVTKNPADSLLQVQKTKTRSAVQSKGFENLKLKVGTVSLKDDLTKKKELKPKQSVPLEKDIIKPSPKSRK